MNIVGSNTQKAILVFGFTFLSMTQCFAQAKQTNFSSSGQQIFPPQLAATTQIFNPMTGVDTSLSQIQPSTLSQINLPLTDPLVYMLNPPGPYAILGPYAAPYISAAPTPTLPANEYARLTWASLESAQGQYTFSPIDTVMQPCTASNTQTQCLPAGVKFSFRIMSFDSNPKSYTNVTTGTDGYPVYSDVPAYIQNGNHGWLLPVNPKDVTQGHYFVPDWNDPVYLQRVQALLNALGQKYNGDPRLAWVDIGLYGTWGEWHTGGLEDATDYSSAHIPYLSTQAYYNLNTQAYLQNNGKAGAYAAGTTAVKQAIVDAYASAFSKTQLLVLTDDGDGVCHALNLQTTLPIGLRRDSLGSGSYAWNYLFPNALVNCSTAADQNMILTRWQTAPFIGEPLGNNPSSPNGACGTFDIDPATGYYFIDEQVRQYHIAMINDTNLCTTKPWNQLTTIQQQAFTWAAANNGYRFAPTEVDFPAPVKTATTATYSLTTHWANSGVTPAYNAWSVEFSLWTGSPLKEVAHFPSSVDLRKILPTGTTPVVITDSFVVPINNPIVTSLTGGTYEMQMRVIDPQGYMNPMQLGLQGETTGGYYPLGLVVVP